MPRVELLSVSVQTGAHALTAPVRLEFNGHVLPANTASGSTGVGETYSASFAPRSMAHSVRLMGPPEGRWAVTRCTVTIDTGIVPYTVEFEPFELGPKDAASLWAEPPEPVFDV